MNFNQIISDLSSVGDRIKNYLSGSAQDREIESAFESAAFDNSLFNNYMVRSAFAAIADKMLDKEELSRWAERYFGIGGSKWRDRDVVVDIVMAGNIPFVGALDLIAVLVSGCRARVKMSRRDSHLPSLFVEMLCKIDSEWRHRITFVKKVPADSVCLLISGSDSTIDLFKKGYTNTKVVGRGSRWSAAILNGEESKEQIESLVNDIILYYGMGCRSISTLILPVDYDFSRLTGVFNNFRNFVTDSDYIDSYRYNRALLKMGSDWFLDTGVVLLSKFPTPPPLGCVNVLFYSCEDEVEKFIEANQDKIQAISSPPLSKKYIAGHAHIALGESQSPYLNDYPDNIDVMEILIK